jgi:precorrin-6A/cobalt-precorrin-6A reductase
VIEPLTRGQILVLGGTSEARELATVLHQRGYPVVSSLAGRVSRPHLPPGEVRIGGFGGVDGLAGWLRDLDVAAVIDATHPFAEQISASAVTACRATGTPLLRLDRPPWTEQPGDRWHRVDDLGAAATLAVRLGRRVFLTIGRQDLAAFAGLSETWTLIRCVEAPAPPLAPRHQMVLARGPFTVDGERELMRRYAIDVLLTRDSGGAPTEAKLAAARALGIPVVIVERPPHPDAQTVQTVAEAVAWVEALSGSHGQMTPGPTATGD